MSGILPPLSYISSSHVERQSSIAVSRAVGILEYALQNDWIIGE
jgi:hypothetical protein